MSLIEKIDQDYLAAVKERARSTVDILRVLKSELKNAAIEKREELTDDEALTVVSREVKKLKDSIESFTAASRDDLKDKAEAELALLQQYLPEQLDEAALEQIVKDKIRELGAESPKDIGRVTGAVMQAVKGQAAGGQVSALVKQLLSE
jgi:uncharacterized protein YqeY